MQNIFIYKYIIIIYINISRVGNRPFDKCDFDFCDFCDFSGVEFCLLIQEMTICRLSVFGKNGGVKDKKLS